MVGSTRRERRYWRRALTDVSSASEVPTFQRSLLVANQISISSPDSDFSLSGHVPLARLPK